MPPKVSVIIPTFNRANLVGNAIQSVLNQTFRDFEVIVVDDGSEDNTKEVVSKFGDQVAYLYQENQERSAARNNGIKHSRGQYITFLDSDDLYLPDKLKVQVELMDKNPEYGMSYSSSVWMDENNKYLHTWRDSLNGWIFPEMMLAIHNKITVPSVMINRRVLDDVGYFNESINICEDYEYWCRIAMKYPVLLIKKALVIINTNTEPSDERFFSYFTSTLSYYQGIFKTCSTIENSLKRDIFSELAAKYYLNSRNKEQKRFVLNEIEKINPDYRFFTLLKSLNRRLKKGFWRFSGIKTLQVFYTNYLILKIPETIFSEDMDYDIMSKLTPEAKEIIMNFYKKDESENGYTNNVKIDRNNRKIIRDILISCNYLHKNRIALIFNM